MDKHAFALSIIRYTIINEYIHNNHLKELIKGWGGDAADLAVKCANMQIQMNDQSMVVLSKIVEMLIINCKHPKKYRDKTSDGIWYCMNCNSDLPEIKNESG